MKKQLTVLITAGPTVEPIDPVRYISNYSSGKMGYAMASACLKAGHKVILVSGPTQIKPPKGCHFLSIKTAREMHQAVMKYFKNADLIFKVAAVADFRVKKTAPKKIKKRENKLSLELVQNIDILKKLGAQKRDDQILVGFAAETHGGVEYARAKLKEKKLDWIVLNEINKKNVGFGSDQNLVTLISSRGEKIDLPALDKAEVARRILKTVLGVEIKSVKPYMFTRFLPLSWMRMWRK